MWSRVYLLDGGDTVGIYSEVEHEVLKIMLKPLPTLKTTLSPSSTPHSRCGDGFAAGATQNRARGEDKKPRAMPRSPGKARSLPVADAYLRSNS